MQLKLFVGKPKEVEELINKWKTDRIHVVRDAVNSCFDTNGQITVTMAIWWETRSYNYS